MNTAWQIAPILGVANVRAAAEYYRDVLGFTLDPVDGVFQPQKEEPAGVYAIVEHSGCMIHLQIRRGPLPARERGPLERDVFLYVRQLDELHQDLARRGAKIIQPPQLAPYGLREMVVEDLNGFRLAFGEAVG